MPNTYSVSADPTTRRRKVDGMTIETIADELGLTEEAQCC
jgi:hypothetical protein